jgi:purine-cytosine permease-like protein
LSQAITRQPLIRVRLTSGTIVELERSAIEGTTLVGRVAATGRAAAYQLEDLDRVWSRGSAVDLGFAIGAGIGFVGGAAAGAALSQICTFSCGRTSGSEQFQAALVGGLVGGVAIGTLGAIFAVATPATRWKTAYTHHQARLTPIVTTRAVGVSLTF